RQRRRTRTTEVEADDEGAESTEAAQTRSKLKLILIIIGAVAVVGGGGGGGYFTFFRHHEGKPEVAVVKPPAFFDVPEVLVNLSNSTGDRTQYLKVKIVLELPDSTMQPQVQNTMPRVMDAFQTYLRELRPSESGRVRRTLSPQRGADPAGQCGDRAE